MRPYITIRPRIKRGVELLKEEEPEEVKIKPKKKTVKKKIKKVVTKKAEPAIDSIMDNFKPLAEDDITDDQLDMELKKIAKIKYNDR